MLGLGFGTYIKIISGLTPSGYDPDAQAFFDRVTTAGGSLTTTEQNAVNQLVVDMKSYGIWTSMKAVYPMVGASAAACAQNLKSSSFTGTFTSGWTFASTGVKGNGTSAYMDTNYKPSIDSNLSDVHLSIYTRLVLSENKLPIGCRDNNGTFEIIPGFGGNTTYFVPNMGSSSFSFSALTNSQGFFLAIRSDSTNLIGQRNSTQYSGTGNEYRPPYNAYLGASNIIGSAGNFSNQELALVSLGDKITTTQASNFYTAVQAFQTTLSRQV